MRKASTDSPKPAEIVLVIISPPEIVIGFHNTILTISEREINVKVDPWLRQRRPCGRKTPIHCHTMPGPARCAPRRLWSGRGQKSTSEGVWLKVYRNFGRRVITHDRAHVTVGGLLNNCVHIGDSDRFTGFEGQINSRDIWRGDADSSAVQLAVKFRQHQTQSFRRTR